MLILASTSDRLQLLVGSAGSINVHASYLDNVAGAVNPGRKNTAITTTGVTEIVAPPLASVQRNVKTLHIHNHSTSPNVVTVQHSDGTISAQLYRQTLQPNDTLQYVDEIGFGSVGQGSGGSGGSTGDARLTLKTVADAGWVMMDDGSIGNAPSGATTRANADCQALFTLVFSNLTDASAPLLTSAGAATTRAAQATAPAAWAANCRMSLPKQLGRALMAAGAGGGLTPRTLGQSLGAETHTQSVGEMAVHAHGVSDPGHAHGVADPGHTHGNAAGQTYWTSYPQYSWGSSGVAPIGYDYWGLDTRGTGIGIYAAGVGIGIYGAGGSAPMDIMNPATCWNVMLKL
jgi:microcystin-dependent protein